MRAIVFAAAALAALAAAPHAWAANVNQPYNNVDHRNDAGNDTGNARVDTLNKGQTDESQGFPSSGQSPSPTTTSPSAPAATR